MPSAVSVPARQADSSTPSRTASTVARRSVSLRKGRAKGRSNVSALTFEEPESTVFIDREMLKNESSTVARRGPLRIDQDGPWSVSVAETPHDNRSYSIYIKTPTHNLTLTRTAFEIIELDHKLHDSITSTSKLPALPLDPTTVPVAPKRKSAFLNTLSRLASPTSAKSGTRRSALPTPAPSPSVEQSDPFQSFSASSALLNAAIPAPSATSTALAAYFTTLSNLQPVRHARAWKRFVRVRTDDLESTRVERAIKRVRSDLATYVGTSKKERGRKVDVDDDTVDTEAKADEPIKEKSEAKELPEVPEPGPELELEPESTHEEAPPAVEDTEPTATTDTTAPAVVDLTSTPRASEDEPRTPSASEPPRMLRSHSADPDRRLSRAYHTEGTLSSSQTETGDESSSISTAARSVSKSGRRKKRKDKEATSSGAASPSASASQIQTKKKSQRKVVVDDFEMLRVLGKGCAGKVLLVRHKATSDLYAMKAITKRHVLAHQELQHTLTEQAVLKRMAAVDEDGNGSGGVKDPFVVKLWWSFHDKENLFLVMDFHPGGDLATQLARWGRLGRDRARFYAAEIVEGVEGLHAAGVIYRDLKPENILIGADGHIVLTDFGLSKEFPRRKGTLTAPPTPSAKEFAAQPPWMSSAGSEVAPPATDMTTTFCGTAEYLAPEVIQALPYSYEIDWWSFGTMLFEMLTGITPFWANNHSDMYVRVLQDELQFPDDRSMDQDTKSLIRGLLQRNPALRIREPRIKRHPYFSMIDWSHVYYKRYIPPHIPPIDPSNASDTQNFDDTFLDMEPVLDEFNDENENENENTDTDQDHEHENTDTDRDSNTTPSQSRSSSIHPKDEQEDDSVDVFDGYSFKGRHSMMINDEDEEEEASGSGEEETDEEEQEEDIDLAPPPPLQADLAPAPEGTTEEEEDLPEPKTPEAHPKVLPSEDTAPTATPSRESSAASHAEVPEDITEAVAKSRKSKDEVTPPPPPAADKPKPAVPSKSRVPPAPRRKERSGVHALDQFISDGPDETEATTERDEDEDDDWDFIEADGGEDRNGAKGTSLFARGVVDRYRLAVFRKASTPSRSASGNGTISSSSVSGMSSKISSDVTASPEASPSPSIRRGRNPGSGLTFRKTPRQFLRPKSPPSSAYNSKSGKSMNSLNSLNHSVSASSSGGLLTPAPSAGGGGSTLLASSSPSLKSKESATSVGAQSTSSDASANGDATQVQPQSQGQGQGQADQLVEEHGTENSKLKSKKLKKYKENAEKVFAIFSSNSPRPANPTSP